jgi:predicted metal-dependent enzyme (double-stranded beta helix superfamily)
VLRQLIDDLRVRAPLERGDSELAEMLSRRAEGWAAGPRLISRPGGYTRTCAYRDPTFEVLLLNWAPGAASLIHDHGGMHCWMLVLDGELDVDDYVRLDRGEVAGYAHVEARDSRRLGPGETDVRSKRFDLHRVTAAPGATAVSLHVYSGPLRRFLVYDEAARRCDPVTGTYDEVLSVYTGARQ